MTVKKIKAGFVNVAATTFVGEVGTIFYDHDTGVLRISDGHTPGGHLIYNVAGSYDQSLNTTDRVKFAGVTATNIGVSELRFADGTVMTSAAFGGGATTSTIEFFGTNSSIAIAESGAVLIGVSPGNGPLIGWAFVADSTSSYIAFPDGTKQYTAGGAGNGTPYVANTATAYQLGQVRIGDGVQIDGDGVISVNTGTAFVLNTATASTLGGVKVTGITGVNITSDGTLVRTILVTATDSISIVDSPIMLPILGEDVPGTLKTYYLNTASSSVLGGVRIKPGRGLSIDPDGTLNFAVNLIASTGTRIDSISDGVSPPAVYFSIDTSTNISFFVNDAGYLTSGTVNQYVTGGTSGPVWELTSSTAVVSVSSDGTVTFPNGHTIGTGEGDMLIKSLGGVTIASENTSGGWNSNINVSSSGVNINGGWNFGYNGDGVFYGPLMGGLKIQGYIEANKGSDLYLTSGSPADVSIFVTALNFTGPTGVVLLDLAENPDIANIPAGAVFIVDENPANNLTVNDSRAGDPGQWLLTLNGLFAVTQNQQYLVTYPGTLLQNVVIGNGNGVNFVFNGNDNTLTIPVTGDILRDGISAFANGTSGPTWQLTSSTAVLSVADDGTVTFPSGNLSVTNAFGGPSLVATTGTLFGIVSQGFGGGTALEWVEDYSFSGMAAAVVVNSPFSSSTGSVQILTGLVSGPVTTNIWDFNTNGTLTLPASSNALYTTNNALIKSISDIQISAGDDIGSNWTFGGNGILKIPGTVRTANALSLASDGTGTNFDIGSFDGDESGLLRYVGLYSENDCVILENYHRNEGDYFVRLNRDGQLSFGNYADALTNTTHAYTDLSASTGTFNIAVTDFGTQSTSTWTFGGDGTTQFPNKVILAPNGQDITMQSTNYAQLMWINADQTPGANKQTNSDFYVESGNATLDIGYRDGDGIQRYKTWLWTADGTLVFPDSTVQSTAWTGTLAVSDLSDVNLTTPPTDGQVLKWNATFEHWAPANDIGSGAGGSVTFGDLSAAVNDTPSGNGNLTYSSTSGQFTYTPPDLSIYTTTATVNQLIANSLTNYLTSASLTGYATEEFVTTQGYITSSTLSQYLPADNDSVYTTTATVESLISNSLTNYVTSSALTELGYITSSSLSVSVQAPNGDGNLSYNPATGVFSFTPAIVTPYTLVQATDTVLGGVKIGSGINISIDGIISVTTVSNYTLNTATASVLGGVKIDGGGNLAITSSGSVVTTLVQTSSNSISIVDISTTTEILGETFNTIHRTFEFVNNAGYITTSSLATYATQSYVTTRGYITATTALIASTASTSLSTGTLWYDTLDGRLYVLYNGAYIDASPDVTYTLVTATTTRLGGVKIGTGLTASGDGTISTTQNLSTTSNVTFNNILTTGQVVESFQTYSTAINNSATINCNNGNTINVTSTATSNWTANLTNLAVITGQATSVTLILNQPASTASTFIPNAISINGTSSTINWQGGTQPSPSPSKKDVVAFSVLQTGASTYLVFGQLVTFG